MNFVCFKIFCFVSILNYSKCSPVAMLQHATSSQRIVFNPAQVSTSTARTTTPVSDDYDARNGNYEFKYEVSDLHTGDRKTHWESRHGDVVRGVYTLYEPDGALRTVEYTADSLHGFNAVVKRDARLEHDYQRNKPSLQKFLPTQVDNKNFYNKSEKPTPYLRGPVQGSDYNGGVDFTVNHGSRNDNRGRKF